MKVKRILIVAFLIIIVPLSSYAESKTYTNYLALGDSITAGYGLKNEDDGYTHILKETYNIEDENFKNLAISGTTAKKFNELIRTDEYKEAIKKADLITISIGANEVLKSIIETFMEVSGITAEQMSDVETFSKTITQKFSGNGISGIKDAYAWVKELYKRITSDEMDTELLGKIEQYRESWKESIDYIKELSPNATIVVTEFYNPFYNLEILYNWSDFADRYMQVFNKYLYEISENETKYKIAKIYDDFNSDEPRLTNVSTDLLSLSIDPHPNAAGHKVIANRVVEILEKEETNNDENKNINIIIIASISIVTLGAIGAITLALNKRKNR